MPITRSMFPREAVEKMPMCAASYSKRCARGCRASFAAREADRDWGGGRRREGRWRARLRVGLQPPAHHDRALAASVTVSSVMFTMRLTVAEGVRMLTGAAHPSRMGPTATLLPAAVLRRL